MDYLQLISGNDIPFTEAALVIHHPTIKEIAYMGEEEFFTGYHILCINKNLLENKDNVDLDKLTNFDIFIAILNESNAVMQKNKYCVNLLLTLLFKDYTFQFQKDKIVFKSTKDENVISQLDNSNFDAFQLILKKMFSTGDESENDLNPAGEYSKRIAKKLQQRHQKLADLNKDEQNQSALDRYVSILAIAMNLSINQILDYTLYQLLDQIKRYELKQGYDIYIQAKMAGATDLKDPEDWMQSIHK